MNHYSNYDYLFKVLIIGDSSVGKSSILLRYVENMFTELFLSTIGVDFKIKMLKYNDKDIKLQIWDTAGQERFKTITRSYYRGANAVIIVYDVTDIESFHHVSVWLDEMARNTDQNVKNIVPILVGNKIDKEKMRQVSQKDGLAYANEKNIDFIEVSSKTGENVEKIFDILVPKLISKKCVVDNKINSQEKKNIELTTMVHPIKEDKGCCNH